MSDLRSWAASLPPYEGKIHLRFDGPVAELLIDDPPTRNALHPHMMVALADRIADLTGRCRVVLVGGTAGAFCSGGNLNALRSHLALPELAGALVDFMTATTERLVQGDMMVLGVVDGPALGGGAELLTACDEVYGSPRARIGFVQARLGVSPGFGGGRRLVARVGPRAALKLLTEAKILDATEAARRGLIDEVVDDPWLRARARAAELIALPEAAVVGARRLVQAAAREGGAAVEREVFLGLWGGPAHLDALRRSRA